MMVQNLNVLYHRPTDVTLTLKDPHYPDHYLGIILLSVILTPKEGEHRDVVSPPTLPCSPLFQCCEPSVNPVVIIKRNGIWRSGPFFVSVSTLGITNPCILYLLNLNSLFYAPDQNLLLSKGTHLHLLLSFHFPISDMLYCRQRVVFTQGIHLLVNCIFGIPHWGI